MLLAIDVGNSETKLGFFEGEELSHTWRVRTIRERTADEYGTLLASLFRSRALELRRVERVAISSVVPQTERELARAVQSAFRCE
ncbi:MAG: type III pantothenate kinase, partial [Vulcanimicrobiaceae bacterium]